MAQKQTTKTPTHVGDFVDGERVTKDRARETQEVGLPLGRHHLCILVLHAERNKIVAHIRRTQVGAQCLSEELSKEPKKVDMKKKSRKTKEKKKMNHKQRKDP